MKVLVTRAEPAASETASRLADAGHEPVLLPLFEIIDTGATIPDTDYDAIVFTSRNAVLVLQARKWSPLKKDFPVFCVGSKTRDEAAKLGFTNTHTANGGGAELAKLIKQHDFKGATFLYASTPKKSFDMAEALNNIGIKVITSDIYQSKPALPSYDAFNHAMSYLSTGYALVYSALSSKHFANLIEQHKHTETLENITLIGISGQAIEPLKHFKWKSVSSAASPDEAEMFKLIKKEN